MASIPWCIPSYSAAPYRPASNRLAEHAFGARARRSWTARTSGNGDGYLLYPRRPGDPPDRFHESVRWEVLRDSIEDYECFRLLRRRLSTAERSRRAKPALLAWARAALSALTKVAQDRRTYSLAPEDYAHVRRLVARAVESLP